MSRTAHAQSCHVQPPQELREPSWRISLAQETAHFESPRYQGYYQGLVLSAGVARQRLYAGAALPFYRIVRNGLPERGLGDLLVHSRAWLLKTDDDSARTGLSLGIALPTGDARADLGMGHVMLTPGVWVTAQLNALLATGQITYGKSLVGREGGHHDSVGPLVAPMSSSELDASFSVSLPVYPRATSLRIRAGAAGALPVLDDGGAARANLIAGTLVGERVKTSFELHLPVTGEPSLLKLVLELSVALR